MNATIDFVLNQSYAALLIFTGSALLATAFTKRGLWRFASGIAGVALCLLVPVSGRSLFAWAVSAAERPSLPGLLLIVVLATAAVTGRHVERSAEFRFGALVMALAGLVLYPAAVGFLDYDTYTFGYSGYALPIAVAAVLAYAVYRGYLITALALNAAIALFLLKVGQSFNLWDSLIDLPAWIAAMIASITIAVLAFDAARRPALVQPSSGIGETPINH